MKKSIETRVKRVKVLAIIVSISFCLGLIYTVKVTAFREKPQPQTVLGVTTKSTVIATETVQRNVEVSGQPEGGYGGQNHSVNVKFNDGPSVDYSISVSFGVGNVTLKPGKKVENGVADSSTIGIPSDGYLYKIYRKLTIVMKHVKIDWYQEGKHFATLYRIEGQQNDDRVLFPKRIN